MSATRSATVGRDVTQDRKQAKSGGLSVSTLMIASASSLAAALVVGLWGGGTLFGAAMTPVIVALVSEGLHRPARAIDTVRQTRTGRYDPVAEGRAGLREGDLEQARPAPVPAAAAAQRRVHRTTPERGRFALHMPRPRVLAAVATGLVAFVIAGIFLTSSSSSSSESRSRRRPGARPSSRSSAARRRRPRRRRTRRTPRRRRPRPRRRPRRRRPRAPRHRRRRPRPCGWLQFRLRSLLLIPLFVWAGLHLVRPGVRSLDVSIVDLRSRFRRDLGDGEDARFAADDSRAAAGSVNIAGQPRAAVSSAARWRDRACS